MSRRRRKKQEEEISRKSPTPYDAEGMGSAPGRKRAFERFPPSGARLLRGRRGRVSMDGRTAGEAVGRLPGREAKKLTPAMSRERHLALESRVDDDHGVGRAASR